MSPMGGVGLGGGRHEPACDTGTARRAVCHCCSRSLGSAATQCDWVWGQGFEVKLSTWDNA